MTEKENKILSDALKVIYEKKNKLLSQHNLKAHLLFQILFTTIDNLNMVMEFLEKGIEVYTDEDGTLRN